MAKRRNSKRVSPGTAASRLAHWRWHHNPRRRAAARTRILRRVALAAKSNKRARGSYAPFDRSLTLQTLARKSGVSAARISAAVRYGFSLARRRS